ncbi:MAG: hypothetical protein K2H99_07620, partial [Paramuribaculum sp.]|nr:hypothetical protein [Paramuribaculum sp.]
MATYQFKKIDSVRLSDAKQLLDKANDGKLVYLDFPIQTLASGTYTADPNTYIVYARDTTGTPLKFVSRMNATVTTTSKAWPGAAFQGTAGRVFTQIPFIPAGGAVGTLSFDENDHPYILLKDEENNVDHFAYCYTGAYKKYNEIFDNTSNGLRFVNDTYICNPIDKILPEHYGKIVYLKANYTKTGNIFKTLDNDETIDVRLTTATGALSCLPSSTYILGTTSKLTDGSEVRITGLVEYDATANDGKGGYFIIPRGISAAQPRPTVNIGNISNGTTLVENSYKLNEDGSAASAVVKMVSGKLLLQLSVAEGVANNYNISYIVNNALKTANSTATASTLTSLVFDDTHKIQFTIKTQDVANTQAPFAVSEPFTLTVADVVSTAPAFNSIAEVK